MLEFQKGLTSSFEMMCGDVFGSTLPTQNYANVPSFSPYYLFIISFISILLYYLLVCLFLSAHSLRIRHFNNRKYKK